MTPYEGLRPYGEVLMKRRAFALGLLAGVLVGLAALHHHRRTR